MRSIGLFIVACVLPLSGCQSLLPQAATRTPFEWKSYEEAQRAVERFVPYKTQRAEVEAAGFDPRTTASLTILSFADLMQRFAAAAALPPEELDRGVRDCLKAGKNCTGYLISVRQVDRKRVGNFWLDVLNFKRVTDSTGWSFNALMVFVNGTMVHVLFGGQPRIDETEVTRNPLGPLQSFGDVLRPPSPW